MPVVNQLKITIEPIRILITSEPYVKYTKRGYQAAVDVISTKDRRDFFIYIGSTSLTEKLEFLRNENNNMLTGIEIWIHKENDEKFSKYVITD
jgi:hypothetical protein